MHEPRIAVLLATFNGARYLDAQVRSLASQTVPRLDVWVSDDGSGDATGETLETWRRRWPKGEFHILEGPQRGFAANFASLLANPAIEADLFAFCDQDDLWDADKLERAAARIAEQGAAPAVSAGRTRLIGPDDGLLGLSPLFRRPPAFRNALVQNIASGNTMVLNRSARDLLAETCRRTDFVAHDWWTYLVVTGAGGKFCYDPEPSVSYRQHGENLIGSGASTAARLRRVAGGRFRAWNGRNVAALRACEDLLTEDARAALRAFAASRTAPSPLRPVHLARAGVFRQTRSGQMALYAACLLGRI